MYQVQDGYSQYKEIDLAARTAAASPLELVLVLFSGLMDELERAKSHCIDSLEVRKKPGGHWIIRDLAGLDLVGLASL